MRGTIIKRKRPSGTTTWGYSLDMGKDTTGKRIRPQVMGFERRADAQSALNLELSKLQSGNLVRPSLKTFGDHVEDWLLHRAKAGRCNAKTIERYREDFERYVRPTLGKAPLQKVTVYGLEALYAKLRCSGGRKGAELSPKTVRNIASMIHAALTSALKWKLIPSNPADACDLPTVQQREQRALDKAETETLLAQAHDHWLYPLLYFAVATGMRRGELLALVWSDIDLLANTVSVSKSLLQTKAGLSVKSTKNNRPRQIDIPHSAAEVLRFHRSQQNECRKKFGSDYHIDLDLVFALPTGEYLKPDSISAKVCLLAGLGDVSMHTLRHSHGSQLLSNGAPAGRQQETRTYERADHGKDLRTRVDQRHESRRRCLGREVRQIVRLVSQVETTGQEEFDFPTQMP